MKTNYQAFTPEEVKKGCFKKLLDALIELQKDMSIDIHITSDGYCIIMEWISKCDEDTASFRFVDSDQQIVTEVLMPDNSYEYLFEYDNRTADDLINEFVKKHPEYKQTQYGTWYDASYEEKLKEEIYKPTKEDIDSLNEFDKEAEKEQTE